MTTSYLVTWKKYSISSRCLLKIELFSTTSISASFRFNLLSFELLYDLNTYLIAMNSINNNHPAAMKSNTTFQVSPQLKKLYILSTLAKLGSKSIKKHIKESMAYNGYLINSHLDKCTILLKRELGTVFAFSR